MGGRETQTPVTAGSITAHPPNVTGAETFPTMSASVFLKLQTVNIRHKVKSAPFYKYVAFLHI